jgi:hypothetical protein
MRGKGWSIIIPLWYKTAKTTRQLKKSMGKRTALAKRSTALTSSPFRRIATMASALKAWSVKEENGLKDFIKVRLTFTPFYLHQS